MKHCKKCGSNVPDSEYGKCSCLSCQRAYHLAKYHEHKVKSGGIRSDSQRLSARKSHIKKAYGITFEEYEAMFKYQSGKCSICSSDIELFGDSEQKVRVAHVDHCHSTGRIRGLLCTMCNTGLGRFFDNPEFLRRAANYLEENQ